MPQTSDAKSTYTNSASCIAMAWSSVLTLLSDQSFWFQKIIFKNPNPASAILLKIVIMVLFIRKSVIIHKEYIYKCLNLNVYL